MIADRPATRPRRVRFLGGAAGSRVWAAFGALTLAYVAARILAFLPATPVALDDTPGYVMPATLPLWDPAFLAGHRPWTVPLLYKLLPAELGDRLPAGSRTVLASAQLAISVAAWLTLAATVAAVVRSRALAIGGFATVLLLSLTLGVIAWDRALISDSVTLSLSALLIAAALWFVRRPSPAATAGLLAVTLLWSFARDTNAYAAVFLVVPPALAAATVGRRRLAVATAVGAFAIVALNTLSVEGGRRWEWPQLNVVGARVVPDAEAREWFVARGMPVTPELYAARQRLHDLRFYRFADGRPSWGVTADKPGLRQLEPFVRWYERHWADAYRRFLVTHPRWTLTRPLESWAALVAPTVHWINRHPAPGDGVARVLPPVLDQLLDPTDGRVLGVGILLALAGTGIVAVRGGRTRLWVVPLAALAASVPLALLSFHGDAAEVERHSLATGLLLRLGVVLLVILALDVAVRPAADRAPLSWRRRGDR